MSGGIQQVFVQEEMLVDIPLLVIAASGKLQAMLPAGVTKAVVCQHADNRSTQLGGITRWDSDSAAGCVDNIWQGSAREDNRWRAAGHRLNGHHAEAFGG